MKRIIAVTTKRGFEDGSVAIQTRQNKNGLTDQQLMQMKNGAERGRFMVAMGVARHGGERCRYLQIEVERER